MSAFRAWQPSKPCTICRGYYGKVLSLQDGVAVISCQSCGLYYVDAVPLPESEERAVGTLATLRGPTYLEEVYGSKTAQWDRYYAQWLRRIEQWTPGRRLLDIGCGAGNLVRTACAAGWDACGLDTSTDTVAYGRHRYALGDRLLSCSLEEACLPEKTFDAVCLFSIIEHIDDPRCFLEMVVPLLRDRGVVVIKTPYQDSLITKLHWALGSATRGELSLGLYNREHKYRFSRSTLAALMRTVGLQVKAWYADDELWITATRYLFARRQRLARLVALGIVHWAGKLLRMPNQIALIAQRL